jgi:hypothetical protein
MIDRFQEVLNQLSLLLDTPLYPDKKGACKLKVNENLYVQIEFQPEKQRLLLMSFICEIPPGKFRENVFKHALKTHYPMPDGGILSYSEKNNQLCLFDFLSLEYISGQKILEALYPFITKAQTWRSSVESGQTAVLAPQAKPVTSGIFGLNGKS